MYYPFILYFNEYVFNLAAHKTAVKPLCNVFLLSPFSSGKGRVLYLTPLHLLGKSVPKKKKYIVFTYVI